MTRSTSEGRSVVEEMFVSRLDANIPEFKHLKEKSPESRFLFIDTWVLVQSPMQ